MTDSQTIIIVLTTIAGAWLLAIVITAAVVYSQKRSAKQRVKPNPAEQPNVTRKRSNTEYANSIFMDNSDNPNYQPRQRSNTVYANMEQ